MEIQSYLTQADRWMGRQIDIYIANESKNHSWHRKRALNITQMAWMCCVFLRLPATTNHFFIDFSVAPCRDGPQKPMFLGVVFSSPWVGTVWPEGIPTNNQDSTCMTWNSASWRISPSSSGCWYDRCWEWTFSGVLSWHILRGTPKRWAEFIRCNRPLLVHD